jgi:hypothetical protein
MSNTTAAIAPLRHGTPSVQDHRIGCSRSNGSSVQDHRNTHTHKHPKVRAWLERHPRWVFHFTPTSASWMNAVEGFFSSSPP